MPQRKSADSLYVVACGQVADLLLVGCEAIDREWEPPLPDHFRTAGYSSPASSPIKTPPPAFNTAISQSHDVLREWLLNLPDSVVETVVEKLLNKVELQLLEDKDKKLIMTLINIERMKMNDFFFGIHSLLAILKGSGIANLHTTKRLWFCLWEYEEITSSNLLSDTLCDSLPKLQGLVRLDLSHVASDRLVTAISYKCPLLKHLCISHGSVSDKGIRALCGVAHVLSSPCRKINVMETHYEEGPYSSSSSSIRSFGASFSGGLVGSRPIPISSSRPLNPPGQGPFSPPQSRHLSPTGTHLSPPGQGRYQGCARLENLDLKSCGDITDAAVWTALENLTNLRSLLYQERLSVFEILIRQGSLMEEEVRVRTRFKLTQLEHGFPYGLSPPLEQIDYVVSLCPYLMSIDMVTEDRCMPVLANFQHLRKLTVELEDCIGEGFLDLLSVAGSRITELTVSCSSDPESNLHHIEGGGQQGQLFNAVVYLAGIHCPQVKKLSVTGCGLVSSVLINNLDLNSKLGNKVWLNHQSKIWFKDLENILLMSYEDTNTAMRVHLDLFRSVLKAAKNLCVLSLEGNFGSFFNDAYLLDAMKVNRLEKLRILDICETGVGGQPGRIPLTIASVKMLLEQCHFLRELRISDWAISDGEFQEIKDLVEANNWNLYLTRKLA